MPLSFPPMWAEESYNTYNAGYDYDYDDYQYATPNAMLRPMEEQKYIPPQEILEYEQPQMTAVGKSTTLVSGLFTVREDSKPMKQWSPNNVMEWLCEEARKYNIQYENLNLESFHRVDGCTLLNMKQHDFIEKDRNFGTFIYQAVDRHRRNEEAYREENLPPFKNIRPQDDLIYTDLSEVGCKPVLSDNDSYQSDASSHCDIKPIIDIVAKPPPPPGRRPVGRPPKPTRPKRNNKEKKCGRLWEFIRDLLLKPEYCPSLICWENHDEGIFRFVRSDKVAELWGTIKDNPKMTYEKLSRAMRYYYKSKVLQPVLGRRLVYKFGPTAKGWRTNNPNFRDGTK